MEPNAEHIERDRGGDEIIVAAGATGIERIRRNLAPSAVISMKPTGRKMTPPPPPLPRSSPRCPPPPPKPQRALATGITVIPSLVTGSPNTVEARAVAPIVLASLSTNEGDSVCLESANSSLTLSAICIVGPHIWSTLDAS